MLGDRPSYCWGLRTLCGKPRPGRTSRATSWIEGSVFAEADLVLHSLGGTKASGDDLEACRDHLEDIRRTWEEVAEVATGTGRRIARSRELWKSAWIVADQLGLPAPGALGAER